MVPPNIFPNKHTTRNMVNLLDKSNHPRTIPAPPRHAHGMPAPRALGHARPAVPRACPVPAPQCVAFGEPATRPTVAPRIPPAPMLAPAPSPHPYPLSTGTQQTNTHNGHTTDTRTRPDHPTPTPDTRPPPPGTPQSPPQRAVYTKPTVFFGHFGPDTGTARGRTFRLFLGVFCLTTIRPYLWVHTVSLLLIR